MVSLGALAWATSATAQERPEQLPLPQIFKAVACYGNLNYPCVVELLEAIPGWYPVERPGRLPGGLRAVDVPVALEAGRILGVSFLALGEEERAREVFRWVLGLDPGYTLAGSEIPPNFIGIYLEVRADMTGAAVAEGVTVRSYVRAVTRGRVERAQRVARRLASRPRIVEPREPVVRVMPQVGVGWVVLGGRDAEVYGDGFGLRLGVDAAVGDRAWRFGVQALYSQHEVTLTDLLDQEQTNLEMLHVVGALGYELRLERFGVRPMVGVGATLFGVSELTERVTPAGLLGVSGLAYIGPSVRLRVDLEGWGVMARPEGELLGSALLSVGGGVGFIF